MEFEHAYDLYPDIQMNLLKFIFKYHPVIIYSNRGKDDRVRYEGLKFFINSNIIKYKPTAIFEYKPEKYLIILIPETK